MARRSRLIRAYLVAVVTTAAGCGSLLAFCFFLWNGDLGLLGLGLSDPAASLWDAGLCLLFFAQHSGMIRRSFTRRLSRVAPEHWHGVVYTLASSVALLVLVACWQPTAMTFYSAEGLGRGALGVVLVLALATIVWGLLSLQEFDAFGVGAFLARIRAARLPDPELTIAGPYHFVRHPFYACGIVALWAAPVLSLDRLILNLLFSIWIVAGAMLEERDLAARFGEAYRAYQKRVPMLLPLPARRPRRIQTRYS